MAKALRRIAFLGAITLMSVTSFGMSYFYFESQRSQETTMKNNFTVDDIKENYINDKTSTEYTIYFFPSAGYMHLESEYLEGNTTIKPEEQFGYKEVQYTETGNILLDDNGNTIYKLSSETGQYDTGHGVTYDGAYRKYNGDQFPCDYFEADGKPAGDENVKNAYGDGTAYTETQNITTADSSGNKRTWGIPNEDFTLFSDASNRIENYNAHNQYSLDRLGCWDDSYYYGYTVKDSSGDNAPTGLIKGNSPSIDLLDDTNTGRYLPIKVTVKDTLSTAIMEKAIPNVFTSMGNFEDKHNYSFVEWTYVANPDDSSPSYPYSTVTNKTDGSYPIGEAFRPVPTERYFDMFSDLSKYADENNVIRLFPLFSNGKKYKVTTIETGGGAAQKLEISYTDGSNSQYKYPFFTTDVYNDGEGYFTYNGTTSVLESQYIRLFKYNNIKITNSSNIDQLSFSALNMGGGPTIGTWQDSWRSMYSISNIGTTLIDNYGEGLYTFYIFVANYSYQQNNGSWSGYTEDGSGWDYDNFYEYIVSQAIEGKFSSTEGKNLIRIGDVSSSMGSYKCSPTVVAFEKIDEPKIISDFPSTDLNKDKINNYIASKYDMADGFSRNTGALYEGESSTDGWYSIVGDDISSSNPYTYVIRNADFTSDTSPYFIVGFNDTYLSSHKFTDANQYDYLIEDPSDTSNIQPEEVFTQGYEYVETVDVTGTDGVTYQLFKFKDGCIGVYDIIIKFNSTNNKYDIYMYRHSNLFCYVFDQDLGEYQHGSYVEHELDSSYKVGDAQLLFERKYFIGQSLAGSDTSTSVNKDVTLDECLRTKIAAYSDTDLSHYKIIDRVTKTVVAEYVESTDDDGNSSYVLKCNKKIFKNYIFYLANTAA